MDNTEIIQTFLNFLKENNKSNSTIIAYKKDLTQLSEVNSNKSFLQYSTNDIRGGLNEIRNTNKLTLKTISRKLNGIKTFFKFLKNNGTITTNPAEDVEHPQYRNKKPRVLTQTECLALREAGRENSKLNLMIELLMQTGIRISELSLLQKRDVFLDVRTPYILIKDLSKGYDREIPLAPRLVKLMKEYLKKDTSESKFLFSTKTSKSIEIRNIRTMIDRVISNARIRRASVNDLRNTFIVNQLENGMSIYYLARIVGHLSLNTTIRYTILLQKKYTPSGLNKIYEI